MPKGWGITQLNFTSLPEKNKHNADGFQCSINSTTNDDYDDESLLKKLCVLLCMPQIAPECTRMHLRTPKITKISWGSVPPDPPYRVNDCRVVMFSTSANENVPPDGKSYVRPCFVVIIGTLATIIIYRYIGGCS